MDSAVIIVPAFLAASIGLNVWVTRRERRESARRRELLERLRPWLEETGGRRRARRLLRALDGPVSLLPEETLEALRAEAGTLPAPEMLERIRAAVDAELEPLMSASVFGGAKERRDKP